MDITIKPDIFVIGFVFGLGFWIAYRVLIVIQALIEYISDWMWEKNGGKKQW